METTLGSLLRGDQYQEHEDHLNEIFETEQPYDTKEHKMIVNIRIPKQYTLDEVDKHVLNFMIIEHGHMIEAVKYLRIRYTYDLLVAKLICDEYRNIIKNEKPL